MNKRMNDYISQQWENFILFMQEMFNEHFQYARQCFFKIVLLVYFWPRWVSVAVQAFLSSWQTGFSPQWLLLWSAGSRVHGLQPSWFPGSLVVATGLVALGDVGSSWIRN